MKTTYKETEKHQKARGMQNLCSGVKSLPEHVNTVDIVITIILALFGLFYAFMMYRAVRVMQFRRGLVTKVFTLGKQSIQDDATQNWYWRFHYYNTVSFDSMWYRFWIPLEVDRWYDSDEFLK